MNNTTHTSTDDGKGISPGGRRFVVIWSIGLLVLLVSVGIFTVSLEYENKAASVARHRERIDPDLAEPRVGADVSMPEHVQPVKVFAGVYLDRIVELSIKDVGWRADFYVWFSWKGNAVNPGENFQIVDGTIESKEKANEYTNGDEHYALYRVVAHITKFFDVSRFPCDDHLMTIDFENPTYQRDSMLFVADAKASSISSRVKVQGYRIYEMAVVEKPHAYKTTRGDPRLAADSKAIYSQLRMGIWISRDGWGFFFKMFLGLFVAVAIAMLAFFIKPTDVDPRFGLGVGALFAAVANTYITSTLLPETGTMALTDVVNGIGILTVFLTLVQSTISLYIYDIQENEALSRVFDKVSFVIIFTGYIVINVALPLAAAL